MVINVPIYIHGMVIDTDPAFEPDGPLRAFHTALLAREPQLVGRLTPPIYTCWGHMPAPAYTPGPIFGGLPALGPDQQLTYAEHEINSRTSDRTGSWNPIKWVVAKIVGGLVREPVVLFGLGDVAYYGSSEGEEAVRTTVYGQIVDGLQPYAGSSDEVRLHIMAHSLGVTVAHDLLYGLFNTAAGYVPGFTTQVPPPPAPVLNAFNTWRQRATVAGTFRVGSFTSAASQIPVTVLRKQSLIGTIVAGGSLDPGDIGIPPGERRWNLFYDTKDALGFRTKPLYSPNDAMTEARVDNSWLPTEAHTGYWRNDRVIADTAALILARS